MTSSGFQSSSSPGEKPLLLRSVPRPLVAAAFCLLTAATSGTYYVHSAIREAQRSEAYLPELEAEAIPHSADVDLMVLLGGRYAEAGDYPHAVAAFKQAVNAGEQDSLVFEAWAAAHAATGDPLNAEAVLEYGLQSGRCQPRQKCQDALNRLRGATTARTPTSEALAGAVSPGGPKQVTARFSHGSDWAAWFVNDGFARREAEAQARPDDLDTQMRWVDALRRNRRERDAETVGQDLVRRFPNSPDAHLLLGDIWFAGRLWAKAGLQYKAALALRPDAVAALKGLGAVGVEIGLYRFALDNYKKATKAASRDAEAWVGLGRAYLNEGFQFDQSIAAFATAAQLAPNRTDFFPYYSDALSAAYRADEAEVLLSRRLQAAPDDARSHYLIARLMLKNKVAPERSARAEEHLRISLKLEPNAPAVRVALAQALLDRGDAQQAADAGILLAEANEQDPLDPLTMRLLSLAYRRIGRLDRAKEAEAQSKRLADYRARVANLEDQERNNPRNITVHESLAILYTKGGEIAKASRQQEMAFMLRHYPKAAQAGVSALNKAATKSGQIATDTRPDAAPGR